MQYHRLDLVDQGVESLEGLAERGGENFLLINLQRNRLTSFEGFGTHPHLTELQLQYNQIASFRGLTKQASLRALHLQGCPIATHPYYRVMALLTIGLGLEHVDGLPVTSHERHVASALGKRAALAVSYGWLLDLHPRTAGDYDAVIEQMKRLRKDSHKRALQQARCVTIDSVLTDVSRAQKQRGYDAAAELQLAERQKTITRLARRVAQLERQLTTPPEAHMVPMLPPQDNLAGGGGGNGVSSSAALFSAAELAQMDKMSFSQGIQVRHNLSAAAGSFQRACLTVDHAALTVESFLTRERIVQLALSTLRVRHVRPLSLVAEDPLGGALELQFDSLPLLHTVYKAIFLLSARPVPLLSAVTQAELQEAQRVRTRPPAAPAPVAVLDPEESAPSISWRSVSERPAARLRAAAVPPPVTASAVAVAGASADGATARAESSVAALYNVADVPPLPAPFSRISTTGRSDSIEFAMEAATRAETTTELAERVETPVLDVSSDAVQEPEAPGPQHDTPSAADGRAGAVDAQRFGNLLVSSTSSESLAFHNEAEGGDAAAASSAALLDSSAVASESGQRAATSSVKSASAPASATPRQGPPAPPRAPPRKALGDKTAPSTAAPKTAPLPRHPPQPRAVSNISAAAASLDASVTPSVMRGGAGASSISF